MNATKIEWVKNPDGSQGLTWNPITGCLNGCPYCYARRLANGRLKSRYLANRNVAPHYAFAPERMPTSVIINVDAVCQPELSQIDPFYPRFWPERLERAISDRGGRGIFTCDMSDLFGIGVPEQWTEEVLKVIKWNENDRFYLLTKQPQNLAKFSPFPDNCYVGVSATNNEQLHCALTSEGLAFIEAKVKYLSIEPLLERLEPALLNYLYIVDWLIIGAQTKPTVYPKTEWVEEIVRSADQAGVPVFLKDNLKPLLVKERDGQEYAPRWANGGNGTLRQECPEVIEEVLR